MIRDRAVEALERIAEIVLGSWPSEGQALAGSFREGVAKGVNGLFEARGTALALAEPSRLLASLHQVRHVRLEHCVGQRLGRRN